MPLPSPDMYSDWQAWARAVTVSLQEGDAEVRAGFASSSGRAEEAASAPADTPVGYVPVWLSEAEAKLYLGNKNKSPPVAADLFQIDTANIAAAAIATANLDDQAVTGAKIKDATIGTAQIRDAAIVTALIGDAQIVTAKIDDLAVNDAKIANAAVTSAKIANLAVGTAKIQDAAIDRTKIGYAAVGTAEIEEASITTALIDDAAITRAKIGDAAIGTAQIGLAAITTALIQDAAISRALIADAAIGRAQIADAAVGTAQIGLAAITTALIGEAAIVRALIAEAAIGSAQIEDASISTAKILELAVNKLSSGSLDAIIDVAEGLFRFNADSSTLVLGNGFGSSEQFFLWFGPQVLSLLDMNEANAVVYIRRDGQAYFGGRVLEGVLRNTKSTYDAGDTQIAVGPFATNGGVKRYMAYFERMSEGTRTSPYDKMPPSGLEVSFVIEKLEGSSWTQLSAGNITTSLYEPGPDAGIAAPEGPSSWTSLYAGSCLFLDNSTDLDLITLRARITSSSGTSAPGGDAPFPDRVTNELRISSYEE